MIDRKNKKSNGLQYPALLTTSLLLFAYQFNTRPIFDDFVTFLWYDSATNKTIWHLLNPRSGYFWIRPIAILIGYIQYMLFGAFMPGYRFVSIAFHAGNALLVSRIAKHNLKMTPGAATAAGWLFLCHPAAVQSVCYFTGQVEVIYLFYMLGAFHVLFNYYQGIGTSKSLIGGSALFCLALLSKETAFALLPVLVGVTVLWFQKRQLRRRGGVLVAVSAGIGVVYIVSRYALYKGVGGYGLAFLKAKSLGAMMTDLGRKLLVDYPVAHFLPLPPTMIQATNYFWVAPVVMTVLLVGLAYRHKVTRHSFLVAAWILVVSSVILVLVVPYLEAEILPPRYLYLGSMAVALMLAPLFTGKYTLKLPIVMMVTVFWSFGQFGFQRDFHGAGVVTEYLLSTLDHYCFYLEAGGRIEVYNVPDRIGAISINIPDKRDNVFNLEAHRRCHLAPLMDLSRGQSLDYWTEYMEALPGRISVYRAPKPTMPSGPDTLIFVPDIAEAFCER